MTTYMIYRKRPAGIDSPVEEVTAESAKNAVEAYVSEQGLTVTRVNDLPTRVEYETTTGFTFYTYKEEK